MDDINLLPLCWFEADRQILLPFSHRRVSEVDAEVGGGVDSQSASLMYHRVAGVETRLFLDLALFQEALCWNRKRPSHQVRARYCLKHNACSKSRDTDEMTSAAGHTHLVGLLGRTWFQWDDERDQPGQELETRDGEVSVLSRLCESQLSSSSSSLNSLLPSCCVVVVWTGWWGGSSSSTGYIGLSETHLILWQCIVGKQPGRGRI